MARVNVEETTFGEGRLVKFSMQAQISIQEALGSLLLLWHDSQELLKATGTKEQIIEWCRLYEPERAEKIFNALLRAPYLTEVADGLFEIHGNAAQIDNRVRRMERGSKGAQATKDKWEKLKNKGHKQAPSLPQACDEQTPTTPNSVQCSSEQCNAVQSSAVQAVPEFTAKELFDFWNETRGSLPKAERLSDARKKKAKAQLAKYPDIDHWRLAIAKFLASDFCVQEWQPGLDELLDETKRLRALEGRYDRKLRAVSGDPPKTREQQVMDHNRSQYERVMKGEL